MEPRRPVRHQLSQAKLKISSIEAVIRKTPTIHLYKTAKAPPTGSRLTRRHYRRAVRYATSLRVLRCRNPSRKCSFGQLGGRVAIFR